MRRFGGFAAAVSAVLLSLGLVFPGALRAGFPGDEKIVDLDLDAVAKSLDPVRVLVTLGDRRSGKGLDLREVDALQEKVMRSMGSGGGRVDLRLDNAPVVAASVTMEGVKDLAAMDAVAAIEENKKMVLHTAQGIPLIRPGKYREQYGGRGVAVAIVDTGVDYRHPALGSGRFPNAKIIGGTDIGDGDPDPMDAHGHGTSCAGIAAGDPTGSGDYIGGVAPKAKVYGLKIFTGLGGVGQDGILRAWDWCITHQNDDRSAPILVISTSVGTPGYHTPGYCRSPATEAVAEAARAKGIAIFVSSGNENQNEGISLPACLRTTIAVGAVYDAGVGSMSFGGICTDRRTAPDQVTCYSNSAPILDLLAPSNNAYTLRYGGSRYTTAFGGTSAACPYAAGAAAVIQSSAKAKTGRFLSVDRLRAVMTKTGDAIRDPKSGVTTPRVNIERAIAALGAGTPPGPDPDRREDDDPPGAIDTLRRILKDAERQ